MAIILDTNCFSHVFCPKDIRHAEFRPVLEWVIKGNGFFVYGGTKYLKELKRTKSFILIFRLLRDLGKAVVIDQEKIDNYQKSVEQKEQDPDFDDPHLPAIVAVSHCKLICSTDCRSIRFVTRKDFYPKGFPLPKYYTGIANKKLLKDTNIPKQLLQFKNKMGKKKAEKYLAKLDAAGEK